MTEQETGDRWSYDGIWLASVSDWLPDGKIRLPGLASVIDYVS